MKRIQIVYIIVSIICIIAIGSGIYYQFFVDEEGKSGIILPGMNNTTDGNNSNATKSQEDIKKDFNNLFNNTLNTNGYDLSAIEKLNDEKDIIYSAYTISDSKDSYEVNINLPVFNIKGDIAAEFNNITQSIFANKANDVLSNVEATYVTIYNVDYVSYINGGILSLIIRSTLKEGDNAQRIMVQTYNYNLQTGEKVSLANMIDNLGFERSDIENKIDTVVKRADEDAKILQQSGYSVFTRDLTSTIYSIDNIATYFLDQESKLYIIFAYGNQNFTSEMDIVLFE